MQYRKTNRLDPQKESLRYQIIKAHLLQRRFLNGRVIGNGGWVALIKTWRLLVAGALCLISQLFGSFALVGKSVVRRRAAAKALLLLATLTPTASAWAQLFTPPKLYSISPTGVNLMDATFTSSNVDLAIGPLQLERTYLGGHEVSNHYFGAGWTHNYDVWATYYGVGPNNRVEIIIARTKYIFYGTPSSNAPDSDSFGTTLQYVSGAYVFTDQMGTVYQFAPGTSAKVASITYPDGKVISITYASGLPKVVSSNLGYAFVFDYGGSVVSAACAFNTAVTYVDASTSCASATLKTAYGYTSIGGSLALTGFLDVRGNTTTMGYSGGGGNLSCITDPGSSTCKVTNAYTTGTTQVGQQTMADGTIWQIYCSCTAYGRNDDDPMPNNTTDITDPRGGDMAFDFYGLGMTQSTDQNSIATQYLYNGKYIGQVTLPEGNKINYNYSATAVFSGYVLNPKPGPSIPNITTDTRTFPSSCSPITCNLPLTIMDANGNVTSYTYDPAHDGPLTETNPADSAGVHPVIRHNYAQRYAWVKDASGAYVTAASPVWLVTDDHTCRTSATVGTSCAAGASDETVIAYDYGPNSGPNNLMLRGKTVTSNGTTYRTCYLYDDWGNKIAETSPRAGLGSCL